MRRTLFIGAAAMALLPLTTGAAPGPPATPGYAAGGPAVWTPGPPPSGRFGHATTWDSEGDRVFVFGGFDQDSLRGDLWELSLADTGWQAHVLVTSPPERYLASSVYDPVRHRMLLFGGDGPTGVSNEVWALSLDDSLGWELLAPSGTPPAARWGHTAVYDAAGDRMIVFGGRSAAHYNDVWALSLSGTPAWTLLAPAGTPPAVRCLHSACIDPVRQEMIVFGGESAPNAPRNDAWVLSLSGTPAWTVLLPGAPPAARTGATLVFDPDGDRAVLFGGLAGGDFTNDVWELPRTGFVTWNALAPAGTPPAVRDLHAAWYDASRQSMVVFGGRTYGLLNDTWILSLAGAPEWSSLPFPGAGPARTAHVAVYDRPRERMVVFGPNPTNQVEALSLGESWKWTTLATSGTPPSPRFHAMGVFDSHRDRLLVFGGYWSFNRMNDLWSLDLAGPLVWTPITPLGTPPSAREGGVMVFDPAGDRVILFGGLASGAVRPNDVWELSLSGDPTWILRSPSGTPPPGLDNASAILDPVANRMLIFGGYAGGVSPLRNQTWALSLDGAMSWTLLTTTGTTPAARDRHTAVYDSLRALMVIFGGTASQETKALALDGSLEWSDVATFGTRPAARSDHSAIYQTDRDRMVIYGGSGTSGALSDVWAMNGPAAPDTGVTGVGPGPVTARLDLAVPRPNPSSGSVVLGFSMPAAGDYALALYDLAGRRVRSWKGAALAAGPQSVVWDRRDARGARVLPGLYVARCEALGATAVRKVIVVDGGRGR